MSVINNLFYRISASAIIGAVVAGGLVYLNNERVIKAFRADISAMQESQSAMRDALVVSNAKLAEAMTALQAEYAENAMVFNEKLSTLSAAPVVMTLPATVEEPDATNNSPMSNNELSDIIKIVPAPEAAPEE
ncbi:MAG: hypothetical protein ACTSRN_02040 [Alphaproteobacteria bacterium]